MPTFTVVAGPNGSGKSTLTRLGREAFQDSVVLDPDAIANSMQQTGLSAGSAIDAGREVLERANSLINVKQSFLVETTLSGNTYLRMMRTAKASGYDAPERLPTSAPKPNASALKPNRQHSIQPCLSPLIRN